MVVGSEMADGDKMFYGAVSVSSRVGNLQTHARIGRSIELYLGGARSAAPAPLPLPRALASSVYADRRCIASTQRSEVLSTFCYLFTHPFCDL